LLLALVLLAGCQGGPGGSAGRTQFGARFAEGRRPLQWFSSRADDPVPAAETSFPESELQPPGAEMAMAPRQRVFQRQPLRTFARRFLGLDGGDIPASYSEAEIPESGEGLDIRLPPAGEAEVSQTPQQPAVPTASSSLGTANRPVLNALYRQPTNDGDWLTELQLLAYTEFERDGRVTIHNVRNAEFFTYRDCLVDYYDKTFLISDVKTVDFIVIPFAENRAIAHTLLSFGLADGDHLGVSVEVRLEKGENYDATAGVLGQYELTYVIASEQDLIRARTEHRGVDVYLYRGTAKPEQAQRLLVDMLQRANKLRKEPEFYNTLSNNCTTNIVRHVNQLAPGRVPYDYRVLLPGYSDQLAYELGLIDNSLPFEEVKRRARINDLALRYRDDPQFSARIRGATVR
jgi:hypothetical protein